jgi:drug/metabolite transporter (DMT)-like permease
LILWAIWGAVADFRYQRRGGNKPTRADWGRLLVVVGLCLGLLVLLGSVGATAGALGGATAFLLTLVFAVWELGRWRVRRRHPLSKIGVRSGQAR